jgi:chromosome segregation ATPase
METRLTLVEREVARLREEFAVTRADAAAARVLATGADRDVSEVRAELRAHTQALNALRETQLEQGQKIDGLERRLGGVEHRLGGVEGRLDGVEREMREGFSTLHTGMVQITALLEGIAGSGRN